MKSPLNAPSAPPSAPRDMDTAGQLSHLCLHVTTINEQIGEMMEKLSNITSQVVYFKEQLEVVYAAIERLEQLIMTQGVSQPQFPYSAIPTNFSQSIQGAALTSPSCYYPSVNRNNLETPTCRTAAPPVAITSPRFGTSAPSPSPCSPSVNPPMNPSPSLSASPPAYLNAPTIKTPQQVVADLAGNSDLGTFYIVTKGREPGIYTDWPKAEALVRGLRHSVYCKKFDKKNAIHVYTNAYEENRLERVLQ